MDDFLYFLLLIGWLAFSFYQQSVKKKKQEEQRKAAARQKEQEGTAADESYEHVSETEQPQPDFKKTLEEILLGGELSSLEDNPEQEAQSLETIPSNQENKANRYQEFYDRKMSGDSPWYDKKNESPDKLEEKIEQLEKEMVLQEEDTVEDATYAFEVKQQQYFDLRKAVIYSEILNAKYVN
ncbi:MAG: hypothetical protein ACLFPE_04410 [Bacteroidales bacterium]